MNTSATIEGPGHAPGKPVFVIPNRVDMAVLRALEELLGGTLTWLVESSLRPCAEISRYMGKKKANGMLFHMDSAQREHLHTRIRAELAAGRHVVLLPGRPAQPGACLADASAELLHFILKDYPGEVWPVYAGMYNAKTAPMVTTQAPYEQLLLRPLPIVPRGEDQADGVFAAWLEASAAQISQLVQGGRFGTLPQALLRSLLAHPQATIIDGVDDSHLSYRHLLFLAAPLARHLRRHTTSRRMGIILPPGKLSIIANVACILAGITPVNIDYSYDSATLGQVIAKAELTRYITEHCFIDMQQDFAWPPQRDIIFIDEVLEPAGFRWLSRWNILSKWLTVKRITSWVHTPAAEPQDEALAVFAPAEEGATATGTSLSHRAVLAGAALCHSRFGHGAGKRVLSALPFHYRAGLLTGLIHPLLMRQDIITYPLPDSGKRLCQLARQYNPAMAMFTPRQAYSVLSHAQEGDFGAAASTACLYVAGKVPEQLVRQTYDRLHLYLCECYLPLEAAMPVACNMPPPAEGGAHIPAGAPGAVGMPLPGVAVRITDIDHPDTPLPLSSPGLVWLKGPGLTGCRIEQDKPLPHERWYCTGDVGCIRPDGLLAIGGARERFSKVKGEILSHTELEKIMVRFLHVEDKPGGPHLAIIGLPDAEGGDEQVILLSTAHKVVGPHDVITLRYDLTNAHYPSHWAPARIVAVRAIPTLPGGQINYALCRAIALRALQQDTPS